VPWRWFGDGSKVSVFAAALLIWSHPRGRSFRPAATRMPVKCNMLGPTSSKAGGRMSDQFKIPITDADRIMTTGT